MPYLSGCHQQMQAYTNEAAATQPVQGEAEVHGSKTHISRGSPQVSSPTLHKCYIRTMAYVSQSVRRSKSEIDVNNARSKRGHRSHRVPVAIPMDKQNKPGTCKSTSALLKCYRGNYFTDCKPDGAPVVNTVKYMDGYRQSSNGCTSKAR